MSQVKLEHLYKRFGNVTAVGDFNLDVKDGEFISFLGPSGCGKTTTLRMIAGFERPTEGSIILGDTVVSSASEGLFMAPEKRDIGMVFQSYAVWPHMTVAENVAYPLKIQGVSKAERDRRVEEALRWFTLTSMEDAIPINFLAGSSSAWLLLVRSLHILAYSFWMNLFQILMPSSGKACALKFRHSKKSLALRLFTSPTINQKP